MSSNDDCLFCNLTPDRVVEQTKLFVVIKDGYPVTAGHSLIIPKRHAETWFDLTEQEQSEANQLLHHLKEKLLAEDKTITGFNIGMNCGASAGQTIFHCHIHLIPRRDGDTPEPRGGVRGVIKGKQQY